MKKMKNILNYILSVLGIKTGNQTDNNIRYEGNDIYFVGNTKLRTISQEEIHKLINVTFKRNPWQDGECYICGGECNDKTCSDKLVHNFTGDMVYLHPGDEALFTDADNYNGPAGYYFEVGYENDITRDLGQHEICKKCHNRMKTAKIDDYLHNW